MVHGSRCSTFDGVGALLFDVLPITIGASPLGQCHNLPLMTKMFLCGGACLYTAVTSSKIAREALPSNGTSAEIPYPLSVIGRSRCRGSGSSVGYSFHSPFFCILPSGMVCLDAGYCRAHTPLCIASLPSIYPDHLYSE